MLPDCCPGTGGDPTPDPPLPPDEPVVLDDDTCSGGPPPPLGFCYQVEKTTLIRGAAWPLDLDGNGHTDYVAEGLWYELAQDNGARPYLLGPYDDHANLSLAVDLDLDGTKELVLLDGTSLAIVELDDPTAPVWSPIAEAIDDATLTDADGTPPLDLAIVESHKDRLGILRADGEGGYEGVSWLPFGNNPLEVVSLDWDHDGRLDLVGSAANDDALVVRRGQGTYFGAPQLVSVGLSPRGLALGDFDGDGHQDVVVANALSHDLTLALTRASNVPELHTSPAHHLGPRRLSALDYDGDGRSDVVVRALADQIDVMWTSPDGVLEYRGTHPGGSTNRKLEALDFEEDGIDELLIDSHQTAPTLFAVSDDAVERVVQLGPDGDFLLDDVDDDGTLDLVLGHGRWTLLDIRARRGPMVWQQHANVLTVIGTTDVDGDGFDDALVRVSDTRNSAFAVVRGGTLPPGVPIEIGETWPDPLVEDVNGDGVLDLLGVVDGECRAHLSDARGGYLPASAVASPCHEPQLVDFDADGWVDLVDFVDGSLTVHGGEGTGTFAVSLELPLEADRLIGIGDVDGDGWPDAVTQQGCCRLGLHGSIAAEAFETVRTLVLGGTVNGVFVLDLDADGRSELLFGDETIRMLVDEGDEWVAYNLGGSDECRAPARDLNGDGVLDLHRDHSDCVSVR